MQSQQPIEVTQPQTADTTSQTAERLPWSEPILQKMPLDQTAGKPNAGGDASVAYS